MSLLKAPVLHITYIILEFIAKGRVVVVVFMICVSLSSLYPRQESDSAFCMIMNVLLCGVRSDCTMENGTFPVAAIKNIYVRL